MARGVGSVVARVRSAPRLVKLAAAAMLGAGALAAGLLAIPAQLAAQSGGGSSSLPVVPSVKILKGTLVAPTTTYYGSATTATNGLCAAFPSNAEICTSERAPELKELARALRNDPNLIYEYVRNQVDTEFQYGLQKGALGALIDGSGTAFDQAHLLVELFRQAGFSARYKVGTITLTAAQFKAWTALDNPSTGVVDAKAACDFLANGGIPASSAAGCTASTALGNVTMAHVWVEADVNGGTYLFDPAYKPYEHKAGIDVRTAMGFVSGQALSSATSGMGSGTQSGFSYVSGLSQSGLATKLATWSEALRADIAANHQSDGMAEIVGGRLIEPAVRPVGDWKQTSFAYTATAAATWTGNIPDQYRTTLTVGVSGGGINSSTVFYVDEIYGRRLQVATAALGVSYYNPVLVLDGVKLIEGTSPTGPGLQVSVALAANHPWAADSGAYGDASTTKPVDPMLPASIVHGWGSTSRALASKWEREQGMDRTTPITLYFSSEQGMPERTPSGDLSRARMGANWLAQFTRATDIHAELANGRATHQHTIGVVSALINYTSPPDITPVPEGDIGVGGDTYGQGMADETSIIDVESNFSLVSRTSDTATRRAAVHAIAATAASLEGSVSAELTDSPDTVSTARRLTWGNSPESGETPSTASRKLFRFPAGGTGAANVVVFENLASGVHPVWNNQSVIGSNIATNFKSRLGQTIDGYTLAGFDVVGSQEALLGPGHRHGTEYPYWVNSTTPGHSQTYYHRHATNQAGGALVATKYDSSGEPEQIAHVLTRGSRVFKGGGGSSVTAATQYDPKTQADMLKDRFVARTSAIGVDPFTGSAGFSSPVLDSVGSGEFPYRLESKVELRGGAVRFKPPPGGDLESPADVDGLVSNWEASAEISSSTMEAMGASRPDAAAETIATFVALQDLYTYAGTGPVTAERQLAAALANDWWGKRLVANVVSLLQGGGAAEQYVRMTDGTWRPASGGPARAVVTGNRVAVRGQLIIDGPYPPNREQFESVNRTWNASNVTIKAIGANGDVREYAYWAVGKLQGDSESKSFGFRLATWKFPQGVTVTLTGGPQVTSVSNNLGLTLAIPNLYPENPCVVSNSDNAYGPLDTAMTIPTISATDAMGGVTRVELRAPTARSTTQRPDERCAVAQIFTPGDTGAPSIRYSFDSLGRIKEARDAAGVRGQRGPHLFFTAEGYRGEREDPLGGRYAMESLKAGRITRHIDELGYVTTTAMDGRGRVAERTFPEGDKVKFTYTPDDRNLPASLTKCPKTGCDPTKDIVVSATWETTWNKPATITDAMGRVSTFTYWDTTLPGVFGDGASLIKYAVRPAPSGGPTQPTYSYWYNSKGLLTKVTDPDAVETESTWSTAGCLTGTRQGPSGLGLWKYFACNSKGDTTEAWDARGESLTKVTTTYDALRRPTQVSAPNGVVTKTTYDADSRPTLVEKRLYVGGIETWQQWSTGYTATGQKWWTKDPQNDITRFEYDALDHKTAEIAPTGDKTGFVYDLAGQMTQIRKAVGVSCGGGVACEQAEQTFTYSPNGQKTSLTDARSNTTTFVFDIHDRLLRTVFPDATWEGSATNSGDYDAALYDKAGNVLKFRTREGTYMSRTYDNLDRKTAEQGLWTDGTSVGNTVQAWRMRSGSFAYTLAGRMSSATTDQVTKAWTYDTAGRPYTHTATMASGVPNTVAQTFTYGWDVAGNLTSLVYPGNLTATYVYDANNRMTNVSTTGAATGAVTLAYDTLSRRTSTTATGNSSQTYAYELDNDVSSISHAFPSETALNVSFSWTYDAMGRQVSETISNSAYQYVPGPEATTYAAANSLNQYGSAGAESFTYRGDGPMATDSTRNFYYDERRNLTKLALKSDANNNDADWFDALGIRCYSRRYDPAASDPHRVELTNGIRPEVAWEEIYSTTNAGVTTTSGKRYYVLGPNPDERLIWIDATQGTVVARYPHANKRGETIAIAKAGTEDSHYVYGAFGESTDAPGGYPWRYTGQRLNEWTRLYHYKARAYSPSLGRFLQPDPIGYDDGPNIYAYVANDGVNGRDPSGLKVLVSGSQADKQEFANLIYRSTGIKVSIQRNGTLTQSGPRDGKVGSAVTAKSLLNAIAAKGTVSFNLVNNNRDTMGDKFSNMTFDVGDFAKFSAKSDKFAGALLNHVITERTAALNNGGDFFTSHRQGLAAEARTMGAASVNNNGSGIDKRYQNGFVRWNYTDTNGKQMSSYSVRVVNGIVDP